MIFLVMTEAGGMPSAASLALLPLFFPHPPHHHDHRVQVFDVAVDHGATRQRLGGVALEADLALGALRQLDHAHAGGAVVEPHQGRTALPEQHLEVHHASVSGAWIWARRKGRAKLIRA
jgi:hypothetical protein